MLHYIMFTDIPKESHLKSFNEVISNYYLVREGIEIIDYKLKYIKLMEKEIKLNYKLLLDIYVDYAISDELFH